MQRLSHPHAACQRLGSHQELVFFSCFLPADKQILDLLVDFHSITDFAFVSGLIGKL